MTRLLVALVLRVVVALCIALAALVLVVAAVSGAMWLFGSLSPPVEGLLVWLGLAAGLLAVARIAHLAIKGLVGTDGVSQR